MTKRNALLASLAALTVVAAQPVAAQSAARVSARTLPVIGNTPQVCAMQPGRTAFLDTLPETIIEGDFVLVHGTLRWPIWEYLYDPDAARAHLTLMTVPFSIVGHTHVPLLVREDVESPEGCRLERLFDGDTVALEGDAKLVLNPGSVGQPRDGDVRASYGIYDSADATFTLHRVEYDIESTQKLMKDAGLPRWLYERLARGR